MTVTGPIAAEELGFTQPHEHVLLDLSLAKARWDYEGTLTDVDVAIREVAGYRRAGGSSLVEMTTADLGRDPLALARVSAETGVKIVMGAGWYRQPYYPEMIDRYSTAKLAEVLCDELEHGVAATGIRPGVIGEIGCDRSWMTAQEERVLRAAARAQRSTGLGLMTHTPPGAAPQQLEICKEEGVDLRRVAIGHSDALMDATYHRLIASSGAFVSFDLVGQRLYPDEWRCRHLVGLLHQGLAPSILLSMDLCHRSRLTLWGGPGYAYLKEQFLPRLSNAGATEEQLHQMTVLNPARFLCAA
jgi:predicted metal-dependent phosphotriesterase family hydrolase